MFFLSSAKSTRDLEEKKKFEQTESSPLEQHKSAMTARAAERLFMFVVVVVVVVVGRPVFCLDREERENGRGQPKGRPFFCPRDSPDGQLIGEEKKAMTRSERLL